MNTPGVLRRRLSAGRFQFWSGLLLSLACLYLAARGLDFQAVGQALASVSLFYVLLAWLSYVLTQVLKGLRWQRLLSPRPIGLSLRHLTDILVIGQATNLLLPLRLGDIIRTYLAGQESGSSKAYILGTVAAEKLLDLTALAVLILGLLPLVALPGWLAARQMPVLVTTLALTGGIAALLAGRRLWIRLANKVLGPLPGLQAARWQARIVAGLDGLAALATPSAALAVGWWTLVIWLVEALTNWLLFRAFDLPAGLLPAIFLLAVLQAGVAVPAAPGQIGVFDYLCVLALAVFGVPASTALGFALVLHVLVVGTSSAWAAIAAWQHSWSWRQLAVLDT